MFILIIIIEKLIIVLNIKWNGINVSINCYKTATRFIIYNKVVFDELE